MVGAALTTGTAIASADSTDNAYITKLHNLGFTWSSGGDSDMVAIGHQICTDRMSGETPDAIASDIHSTLGSKGYSFADVTGMVSAAESVYCPD
jgi:hypothetical protein